MLYQMLEKVNEDRQRRIQDKNQALMKKIKRLERRREAIERGEQPRDSEDEMDEFEEEIGRQPSYPQYRQMP